MMRRKSKSAASSRLDGALRASRCERNWLDGALGGPFDRMFFGADNPALFGFDESINEQCSTMLGVPAWDDGDLNLKIANRCRDARRNVLRMLTGGWTMCQNLEWQLCALQGKLPAQGEPRIAFATAPASLQLEWWERPSSHPTYPCDSQGWCNPAGFTVYRSRDSNPSLFDALLKHEHSNRAVGTTRNSSVQN